MTDMEFRRAKLINTTERITLRKGFRTDLQHACGHCAFFGTSLCGYTRPYDSNSAGRLAHDLIDNKEHHQSRNTEFRKTMKNKKLPDVPCDIAFLGEDKASEWSADHLVGIGAPAELPTMDGQMCAANDDTFRDE